MKLWLNIYAKKLQTLCAFYEAIGFTPNPAIKRTDSEASFVFDNVTLMVFSEGFFNRAFPYPISTPNGSSTVLFSFSLPTVDEAENMVQQAIRLGGQSLNVSPSLKQPGFYNTGFIDPEGHAWNILITRK